MADAAPRRERVTVAIGDIHGQADRLERLLAQIGAWAANVRGVRTRLVFLGDFIDRGPESKRVVDRLRALQRDGAVCLRGNHEEMMVRSVDDGGARRQFVANGGDATLRCFGEGAAFDDARLWMASLPSYYEDTLHYFVHAGVDPHVALARQSDATRLWIRRPFLDFDGAFEKYVVHGHTPTRRKDFEGAESDVRGNRCNLDTGAGWGGPLSAAAFEERVARPVQLFTAD
jgi:serine/threonine protein phosphatase 1